MVISHLLIAQDGGALWFVFAEPQPGYREYLANVSGLNNSGDAFLVMRSYGPYNVSGVSDMGVFSKTAICCAGCKAPCPAQREATGPIRIIGRVLSRPMKIALSARPIGRFLPDIAYYDVNARFATKVNRAPGDVKPHWKWRTNVTQGDADDRRVPPGLEPGQLLHAPLRHTVRIHPYRRRVDCHAAPACRRPSRSFAAYSVGCWRDPQPAHPNHPARSLVLGDARCERWRGACMGCTLMEGNI
ncbi:hypothetical protein BJX99DRAFT_236906 [Aspergillus californicus]